MSLWGLNPHNSIHGGVAISFRNWLLKAVYPLSSKVGTVHMPYSRKKIQSEHYRQITKVLRPGVGLLTLTYGELSNVLIPGYWSHVGAYCGHRCVVEAVGKGVVETDLIDFALTKDEILVVKPTFATLEQMEISSAWMSKQIGKPYDMQFRSGEDAFFCSELYVQSYARQGIVIPWKVSTSFGVDTPIPQDIADFPEVWEVVAKFPP